MKDYEIEDSGDRTKFSTGAHRDLRKGKGRFDLIPWRAVRALAIHMEKGCEKYGERNWEKGIPVSKYFDSATRHLMQFYLGSRKENHLAATLWNVSCMYETIELIEEGKLPLELYDLPERVIGEVKPPCFTGACVMRLESQLTDNGGNDS